jgi:hypothetical protein
MPMKALIKGERGSTQIIEFVLILPIFVLILYGSFEVWKIVSVKQSLDAAVGRLAQCLRLYHVDDDDRDRCERIVWMELGGNSVMDGPLELAIGYYDASDRQIPDPTNLPCHAIFTTEGVVRLPWGIPILSSDNNMYLISKHTSFIECEPSEELTRTRMQLGGY